MKYKIYKYLVLSFITFLVSCAEIEIKPLTDDVKKVFTQTIVTEKDIVSAFKEVLTEASVKSVSLLSSSQGFIKDNDVAIPFPVEALKLEQTLRKIGFGSLCDDFYESMNLAAEKAVAEATPLFIEAIKNITFTEASKLLKGNETAITDFLRLKTSTSLTSKFNPIVSDQLDEYKVTKKWKKMIEKYNKLPMVKPVQSDLPYHVTQKSIEGLFFYISKEEKAIRKNPSERTTELIKKVFAQID